MRHAPSLRNGYHRRVCDPVSRDEYDQYSESGSKRDTDADLDGLLRNWVNRACSPDLEFVENHVPQTLVVDHAYVDVCCELLARDPRIHRLIAVIVVPGFQELLAKVVDGCVLFREPVELTRSCYAKGYVLRN